MRSYGTCELINTFREPRLRSYSSSLTAAGLVVTTGARDCRPSWTRALVGGFTGVVVIADVPAFADIPAHNFQATNNYVPAWLCVCVYVSIIYAAIRLSTFNFRPPIRNVIATRLSLNNRDVRELQKVFFDAITEVASCNHRNHC